MLTQQMLEARETEKKRINEIIAEEKRQHEARLAAAAALAAASGTSSSSGAKNKATPGTAVKNSKFKLKATPDETVDKDREKQRSPEVPSKDLSGTDSSYFFCSLLLTNH